MHQLNYCDEKRGIHGALLGELLHTWQHGLFLYAVDAIFKLKRVKKNTKYKGQISNKDYIKSDVMKESENKAEDSFSNTTNDDTDISHKFTNDSNPNLTSIFSTRNVFSKDDCDSFDSDAIQCCFFNNKVTGIYHGVILAMV